MPRSAATLLCNSRTILARRMPPAANHRAGMIAHHLSGSASSSALPTPSHPVPEAVSFPIFQVLIRLQQLIKSGSPSSQPVVVFEAIHSLRKMTLNRPRVLNALNDEMVALIQPQLQVYFLSSNVQKRES